MAVYKHAATGTLASVSENVALDSSWEPVDKQTPDKKDAPARKPVTKSTAKKE